MSETIIKKYENSKGKPFEDTSCRQFPTAFVDNKSAKLAKAVQYAAYCTNNWLLEKFKEDMFVPRVVTIGDTETKICLAELFEHKHPSVPDVFAINGKQCNKSIFGNPGRESIVCGLTSFSHDDVESFYKNKLAEYLGCSVDDIKIPALYRNEALYKPVTATLKGSINKKLNNTDGNVFDKTWLTCAHEIAHAHETTDTSRAKLAQQLNLIKPQFDAYINHTAPTLDNWPKNPTYKVDDEHFMNLPTPELNEQFVGMYQECMEKFIKRVIAAWPEYTKNDSLFIPIIKIDWDTIGKGYYEISSSASSNAFPVVDGYGMPKIVLHASSSHSSYYDVDFKTYAANKPALRIKVPTGVSAENMSIETKQANKRLDADCTSVLAYSMPNCRMSLSDNPNLENGVGIDLGIRDALMYLSCKSDDTIIDWVKCLAEYRKDCPDAALFKTSAARLMDAANAIADHASDADYKGMLVFLLGVRDGKLPSENNNWMPTTDPLQGFFKYLLSKKKFHWTDGQIAYIGHTRTYRKLIRQMIAEQLHYHAEQSKWDLAHDGTVEVFAHSELAEKMHAIQNNLANRIDSETQRLICNGFLDVAERSHIEFISMEDVNLGSLKVKHTVPSLYSTAKQTWHMADAISLTVSKSKNEVVFTPGYDYNLDYIEDTDYWLVDTITQSDGSIIVQAHPTDKYVVANTNDWIDSYLNKAIHFSSIKHTMESLCQKRGILLSLVAPKYTSQICHVCHAAKYVLKQTKRKSEEKKKPSVADCMKMRKNYRNGRVFVCGNPDCRMFYTFQHADENAALNILYKPTVKPKKRQPDDTETANQNQENNLAG